MGFSSTDDEEVSQDQVRGVAPSRKRTNIKLGHKKRIRKHNKSKKMKFNESDKNKIDL